MSFNRHYFYLYCLVASHTPSILLHFLFLLLSQQIQKFCHLHFTFKNNPYKCLKFLYKAVCLFLGNLRLIPTFDNEIQRLSILIHCFRKMKIKSYRMPYFPEQFLLLIMCKLNEFWIVGSMSISIWNKFIENIRRLFFLNRCFDGILFFNAENIIKILDQICLYWLHLFEMAIRIKIT